MFGTAIERVESISEPRTLFNSRKSIVSLAISTVIFSLGAYSYHEGYLPAKGLLDSGWTSKRIEESYEECSSEMPFYWSALSLPGRHVAYFLKD